MPDVKVLANVPILRAAERRSGELVVSTGASPRYHEAMMTLGFALEDHRPAEGGQVLALSSALSGEGKSVTIANLALGLAEAGHRVLLVDSDFCRPRQHEIFGLSADLPGLAQILRDGRPLSEVVQARSGIEVLPVGSDPGDLALPRFQRKLQQCLGTWRQSYDFILLDLPPMALFATVARIAKQADGLLVLANLQRVTPDILLPGLQQLQALRIPVHGIIVLDNTQARRSAEYSPYLIALEGGQA
ncbi:Tyrosine-protein kinase YwqD [compost metagenome]